MATDFLTLLQRDHHDLAAGLAELVEAETIAQIRSALDGVRLGLTAHAEAEDIVLAHALARCPTSTALEPLVDEALASHVEQSDTLAALVSCKPGSAEWRALAARLRRLVVEHAAWEERYVLPALRAASPEVYASLAGAFATERLRQLAMLQPSVPFQLAG
ncbi:MAG TPA: hemerythrin domain-containing protein [Kofleriaceae bacterium]|nr:hemerythrin domain-containing protein [Kofleriaceae bacterium]